MRFALFALVCPLLLAATGAGARSVAADADSLPPTDAAGIPHGRWRSDVARGRDTTLDAAQIREIERLESLGYLAGSRPAFRPGGVSRHDPEQAHAGRNLYTSGHAPEAILIDMDGEVLHRWRLEFDRVWPDFPLPGGYVRQVHYWRRAYVQPNGDLLAIFEGLGLVKLDRQSRLIWSAPIRSHHALEVQPDGGIVVLTREARILPRIHRVRPVLEDFISVLDADGKTVQRVSLLESFERSPMRLILEAASRTSGDLFHTNHVEMLGRCSVPGPPGFAAGNVLVSMRELNTIAVVDLAREEVVWAHQGDYVRQHDPHRLANGNILLFDNGSARSRVLEIDPVRNETVWSYAGTAEDPFFSPTCGTVQRLSNGNTLITESDPGRAFEVTPGGEIVWEFVNPNRAGEDGRLIATLFEMRRLPGDFGDDWLEDGSD